MSSSPTITYHPTQAQAYGHASGVMSEAIAAGEVLELQVQAWHDGWRVIVFDLAPAAVSA